jgi:hypothetical protein
VASPLHGGESLLALIHLIVNCFIEVLAHRSNLEYDGEVISEPFTLVRVIETEDQRIKVVSSEAVVHLIQRVCTFNHEQAVGVQITQQGGVLKPFVLLLNLCIALWGS